MTISSVFCFEMDLDWNSFPQDRNVSNEGNLFQSVGGPVVQESADGKILPFVQLDLRIQLTCRQGGNIKPLIDNPFVKSSALTSGIT